MKWLDGSLLISGMIQLVNVVMPYEHDEWLQTKYKLSK